MRTSIPTSALKIVAFTFMVLAASFTQPQTFAQTAILNSMPAAETAKSFKRFQAIAFPSENASKIKVIIEDLTGNGALIVIRDRNDNLVHQTNCSNKGLYARVFDISVLPDGEYALEIMALSELGFVKHKYTHNFKIQSSMERTIKPWNKEIEKKLFKPRNYQVRR